MTLSHKKTSAATSTHYLTAASERLEAAGIPTARLDTLVLMEDVLNTNRAQILANPDLLLHTKQQKRLDDLVARRARHEPLAYIRNRSEFYGREFYINTHVLEPRSESEAMIELLLTLDTRPATIIDVGTGSGALAITAQLELPSVTVVGVDIDAHCLRVARKNAKQLEADVTFIRSNLLDQVPIVDMLNAALLCNLPYVPDDFHINTAAMHEPRLAIFGGRDGLDIYRKLFAQIANRGARPKYILTESLPPQHKALKHIAEETGFVLAASEDFIQVFRTGTDSSGL